MTLRVSFRVDRDLPDTICCSPLLKTNLVIDIFDRERLETAIATAEASGAVIVSSVSIVMPENLRTAWENPDPDWVAAVVGSNNHEWVAPENYRMPYDLNAQRVAPELPLRIFTGPEGLFTRIGFQFAGRTSFRKFVDEMPESFEYSTGDIVRRGKVLESWSRIEPVREMRILSNDSLGSVKTNPHLYRANLLWIGNRVEDDFGFVWDPLLHGTMEQERCALVTITTARRLMKRFPVDFSAKPVYDRESTSARRVLEVFQMIRERLPFLGWSYPNPPN